ncbi:MAG: PQQ-binding-like beta-propeller repeat protein [Verrucomicrobiales bacterium]
MHLKTCLSVAILFCAVAAQAEDWPMWRFDALRTAVTTEHVKPPLDQVWTFRSRQSGNAPKAVNPTLVKYPWVAMYTLPISAAGDSVFFTSAADGRIGCLNAASGKLRWEFLAGCGVNRAPTFWKGKVYAGSHDGNVYCLDAKTGKPVWTFKAAPDERWFLSYNKPVSVWPVRTDITVAASPTVNQGNAVAYFAAGVFPHDGTFLYAVDAETGKRIWRNATHAESGWRASMAPAGYLYVTEKTITVPRDFWGYFSRWGTLITFDRATGAAGHYAGSPPIIGVKKDNIQYFGSHAAKTEKDKDGKDKATEIWRENVPGRWVDLDSAMGTRGKRPVYFRWDPDSLSVVYAGGVVYSTAFETDAKKGMGTGIYARNAADGKLLWSADVDEQANQIIVANGRVFLSSRQGTIYGYAPVGAKKHGVIAEAVKTDPFAENPKAAPLAQSIIKQSGIKAGYAVVVDCENGALAYELARHSDLYVIAVFDDANRIAAVRKAYSQAGMHVSRIVAYHRKAGSELPFSSYLADLIVSEAAGTSGRLPKDFAKINRVLKPIRGIALFGGEQEENDLKEWIAAKQGWEIITDGKHKWARHVRPPLPESGGWTHAFGDAGHTGSSHDGALKPPLGIYWYGEPQLEQGSPGALMIDGVFLLCKGTDLHAYDEYTGRELWSRGQGRTDTVCGPGSVFLRYLEVIVRLNPATGEEIQAYLPPFEGGKWNVMAAAENGETLYLVAGGKSKDDKKWSSMMAVDVVSGKPNWMLGGPGEDRQWSGWSAIGDGYMYMITGSATNGPRHAEAISEMRAHLKTTDAERLAKFEKEVHERDIRILTTIDTKTGKILYEHGVDLTNCGGRFLPSVGYGGGKYARHYNPGVGPWTMARKGLVVFGTMSGADKGWRVWPAGGYKQRGLAVHDGATGKLLWNRPCNYRTRPVIIDETIYAEPWGYDLRTGKRKQRKHPVTGQDADWVWCRSDKQCGSFSASKHFLFGRSLGVGYHDLLSDNGLYTFWHSRMSCSFDAFTGGGMMIKPPNAVSCKCTWSLPFTIALGQVSAPPPGPQDYAQPGPIVPVKHLYVDVGANGSRRDERGNLWIPPTPGKHHLLLRLGDTMATYEGGSAVVRSSLHTPVENTTEPFVFASAFRGLKHWSLPINIEGQTGNYTVRLGFAALPGDQPGQRVFDVKLNGKMVLKKFDIMKEAGKADRAVWKEFKMSIGENLTVELVASSDKPDKAHMPLLNGIQVLK